MATDYFHLSPHIVLYYVLQYMSSTINAKQELEGTVIIQQHLELAMTQGSIVLEQGT